MKTPVKTGIIGIGKISDIYLQNLTEQFAEYIDLVAVSDLIEERATKAAETYGIPQVLDTKAMIEHPEIELIINLTTPQDHFGISEQALLAGKHVYVEKPISLDMVQANRLIEVAAEKNLHIGGAPDTFLGAGLQTARKVIEDGQIGTPIGAGVTMMNHGHEHWHPSPEFYYKKGGGPMYDMGPYYITALIHLLGPALQVSGFASTPTTKRTIESDPLKGTVIDVEVPTHVVGMIQFADEVTATITTSFNVWNHSLPCIEIYGTEGTLQAPDPNTFGGPVKVRRFREKAWTTVPLAYPYEENSRGLGIAEMAQAIRTKEPHRTSGALTLHVLEIMEAIHLSSAGGTHVKLRTTCEQPSLLRKLGQQAT